MPRRRDRVLGYELSTRDMYKITHFGVRMFSYGIKRMAQKGASCGVG